MFGAFGVAVFDGVEHFGVVFHYAVVVAFYWAGVADTHAQGGGNKIAQANVKAVVAGVENADVKGDVGFQVFFAIFFGVAHALQRLFNGVDFFVVGVACGE